MEIAWLPAGHMAEMQIVLITKFIMLMFMSDILINIAQLIYIHNWAISYAVAVDVDNKSFLSMLNVYDT